MKTTLATQIAQAIDPQTLVETAATRVAAMFPFGSSDDGMDYAHAASQCLAELMNIVRANAGGDPTNDIAEWLSTPGDEWYACDGDIRYDLDSLINDPALANEWADMVEAIWD